MASNSVYRGYYSHRPSRGGRRPCKGWANIFSPALAWAADAVGQVQLCFRCCLLTLSFLFLVAVISFAVPPLKQKYWNAHEITALKGEADRMSKAVKGNLKVYDSLNQDVSRLSQETLNLINMRNSAASQDPHRKPILKNANMERELQSIDLNVDGNTRAGRAVREDTGMTAPWIPEREKISVPSGLGCEKGKNVEDDGGGGKGKFYDNDVCTACKLAPNSRRHSFSSSADLQCKCAPSQSRSSHYGGGGSLSTVSKWPGAAPKTVRYKHMRGDNPVAKKQDCSKCDKDPYPRRL